MRHRRAGRGLCIGAVGLALTFVPMSAASAHSNHKPTHHKSGHSKGRGSNPGSAMCQDIKTEESGNSQLGIDVEKAMESGNFAQAKQALLNAYDGDLGNVNKALSVIKGAGAPANVQAAFKNLLSFVQQIKSAIGNATSLQGLVDNFEGLSKNTQLASDGSTIANWAASVCGSSVVPTTAPTSVP
jgi:hypothetical protein